MKPYNVTTYCKSFRELLFSLRVRRLDTNFALALEKSQYMHGFSSFIEAGAPVYEARSNWTFCNTTRRVGLFRGYRKRAYTLHSETGNLSDPLRLAHAFALLCKERKKCLTYYQRVWSYTFVPKIFVIMSICRSSCGSLHTFLLIFSVSLLWYYPTRFICAVLWMQEEHQESTSSIVFGSWHLVHSTEKRYL